MPINWVDVADPHNPPNGAPTLSAANLAKLAVIGDMAASGTATGDALRGAQGVVNVRNYGAKGDGTTDDTAAFQAAADAALAAGHPLRIPGGTYRVAGLIVRTGMTWRGAGPNVTILKAPNGSTAPVIISDQFATLTGGATSGGVNNVNLSNFSIDGNKANCPSGGNGISIYGWGYRLDAVMVHDCNGDGIYSEWGNNPATPGNDSMEAQWHNIKSHDNNGNGIRYNGPHDSQLGNIVSYHNVGMGVWMGPLSSGTQVTSAHSWGATQTYAWYLEGSGLILSSVVGEGGSIARFMIGGKNCQLYVYCYSGGTANPTGILIGDATHTGITGTVLIARIEDCTGNPLDFTYDGGHGVTIVTIDQTGGNSYTGTPGGMAQVSVNGVTGTYGCFTRQADFVQFTGGGANAFALRNAAGTSYVNQNNSTQRFEMVNGNSIRLYSDSFTTVTGSWRGTDGKLTLSGPVTLVRVPFSLASAGAVTFDASKGNIFPVTLSANATNSSITNPSTGQIITIEWVQDGTGGRTYSWPSNCKFANSNVAPADTTAFKRTSVTFEFDGTNWLETARAVAVG